MKSSSGDLRSFYFEKLGFEHMVLLIASGLMIRTFVALRAVHPGFSDPHHVQLVRVMIPQAQVADR